MHKPAEGFAGCGRTLLAKVGTAPYSARIDRSREVP
jgi:hypothetical protein